MNTRASYRVNPGWALLIRDVGAEPSRVARRAGLPADLLSHTDEPLHAAEYFALWNALDAEVADPALPVLIARTFTAESFDPTLFAGLCSPNLAVAATCIATYKRLISPVNLAIDHGDTELALSVTWDDQPAPPAALVVTELLFWVALARLGTRRTVHPVRVTSCHPPSNQEAIRIYLGGLDIVRADTHRIAFSDPDARRPFLTNNSGMWRIFEPELRRRLADLDATASTTDRVRAALTEALPAGRGSVTAVAGDLHVSPRTLQRQLAGENTTFQHVLSTTRKELARHYLATTTLNDTEIALLLGYDEPTSFHRAFHAWTGRTPGQARTTAR